MSLLVYGYNGFPGKRVPEIFQRLQIIHFYQGGITWEHLSDGELFNAAFDYMFACNEADKINRARAEANTRR